MRRIALAVSLTVFFVAGCSKPDANALFAKGNTYFEQGQFPEAVIQYKMAVQADPKRGEFRVKLSEAYLKTRNGRGAVVEAIAAADLLPNDVAAQVRAGTLLLLAGQTEDGKTRADKALALDPKNPEALILKGNALAGLKDLEGALTEYQEAIALDPAGDTAYRNIGFIQYSRGQVKEAEATLRKAVEVAPKSLAARSALASLLWASKRPAEAEAEFKEALALDPANVASNRALGIFYLATGRSAEAETYFKSIAATLNSDPAQLALADYYISQNRLDQAVTLLTPLSQKKESFEPASLRLAAIEVEKKNRGVAATIIRGVLDRSPDYAPARQFEIRLLLLDNKLDEAMKAASALVKDEPNSAAGAEAQFVIGRIEDGRDRTEEAIIAYEAALRIQPQAMRVVMALARLNVRIYRPDKAETYARQVLAAKPNDPDARALLVRTHLMRNELDKAAQELATLEKEFPTSLAVQNLVAARNLAAGRTDAARAGYAKVYAASPNSLEALQGLLIIEVRSGRKKEALERVEAALKSMPPSAELYVLAARVYDSGGNKAKAEELLKQAIDREPARLLAYSLLGNLYASQNRLSDARDQFQELLKRNPRSVPAGTMLGMLLEAQKDLPAAEAQYLKTLAVDSTAAVAANNLAWLYVSTNRNMDQAQQLAQTALKSLPEEPHVNDTLGWIYYRKGQYSAAVRHLETSVKRDATDPSTHYHLGMAYSQVGEIEKARASLKKALSMSQTFEGADEARKTLASLGG